MLLARLDQLLIEDRVDRWVVVTGGPGMGKSALLAAWLLRREAAGAVVPHHFIRRGEYDWDDPAKLVGSLMAQLEARFPDQREPEADARMHPAAQQDTMLRRISDSSKVWYLESYACVLTHRANGVFTAVAATATTIVAGDAAGSIWFLDFPLSSGPPSPRPRQHKRRRRRSRRPTS